MAPNVASIGGHTYLPSAQKTPQRAPTFGFYWLAHTHMLCAHMTLNTYAYILEKKVDVNTF